MPEHGTLELATDENFDARAYLAANPDAVLAETGRPAGAKREVAIPPADADGRRRRRAKPEP